MEQTFMTIHNLNPDANILFASESVADILGYQPAEAQGKSAFDYFHPDEVPFARSVHSRGVLLDKAAVLCYARILSRDGRWVSCECCFTIVHDVLVACTSIYRRGAKSERIAGTPPQGKRLLTTRKGRAIEAPQIRRIFSCSPRDPRYHMLEHLSPKFKMPPMEREPRAALILNRFTRNLTVMFATNAITSILGLRPDQVKNKSFYRCIQESCMAEATKCLESAKANDSIAYLRFCFQDPREDEEIELDEYQMEDAEEAGIQILQPQKEHDNMAMDIDSDACNDASVYIKREDDDKSVSFPNVSLHLQPASSRSASATVPATNRPTRLPSVELEAVVSCTSDGLVVILRKARPPIPPAHPPLVSFDYGDGLFAAPWGQHPIQPHFPYESLYTFRPPLLPQYMPLRDNVKDAGGPPLDVLMGSIRDVAVFAWGLVGINPGMAAYSRGHPSGDARPIDDTRSIRGRSSRENVAGSNARSNSRSDNDNDSSRFIGNPSSWLPNTAVDKGKGPAIPSSGYGQYTYTPDPQAVQSAFQTQAATLPESRTYPPAWTVPIAGPLSCGIASTSRPASFDYVASPDQYRHNQDLNVQGTATPSKPYYGLAVDSRHVPYQQQSYGTPSTQGPRQTTADSSQDRFFGWQ